MPRRGSNAGSRLSFRTPARTVWASLGLLFVLIAVGLFTLTAGRFNVGMMDVVDALSGRGAERTRMIVVEWRLPRLLLAGLLGAALGLSGAIFQSLTRNPLGSPDIMGFAAGAYTGALLVILLFAGGYYLTAAGAIAGGLATATLVYVFAGAGGNHGFRLIVIGIGTSAMLSALNAWMIRRADLDVAMGAALWSAGSLNGLGFEQLVPAAILLALLAIPIIALARPMRQMELGEDVALASGIATTKSRLGLTLCGVALTAIVTAVAGPISFVALAAPQIAHRLALSSGTSLLLSGLMGAVLLTAADAAAQHAFGLQLPVGVMTVSVGGFYFLWLLIREGRR
ncbi:iron ABC transporter permease [Rhizobium sp. AC44/96]|nr:iron ABC transporter permease [Rhizobium sp. AC44/96]